MNKIYFYLYNPYSIVFNNSIFFFIWSDTKVLSLPLLVIRQRHLARISPNFNLINSNSSYPIFNKSTVFIITR
jgi:hypothetical protein